MKKKFIETQKKAMMWSPLHTSVHKKLYEITDTTELWCRWLCIIIDRYLFDKIWYSAADQSLHSFRFLLRAVRRILFRKLFGRRCFRVFPIVWGECLAHWFFSVLFTPTKLDERVYVYTTYTYNIRYYIFFLFYFYDRIASIHARTRTRKIIRVQSA